MRKGSCVFVVALAVLALLAGPAAAQDNSATVAVGWAPSVGFGPGDSAFVPLGFDVNAAIPIVSNFQLMADLGYNHKYSVDLFDLAIGARYMIPTAKTDSVTPFGEALLGLGHIGVADASGTGLAFGFGAGADVKAISHFNLRIEAQYMRYQVSGFGANELRLILGVSKKLNR